MKNEVPPKMGLHSEGEGGCGPRDLKLFLLVVLVVSIVVATISFGVERRSSPTPGPASQDGGLIGVSPSGGVGVKIGPNAVMGADGKLHPGI